MLVGRIQLITRVSFVRSWGATIYVLCVISLREITTKCGSNFSRHGRHFSDYTCPMEISQNSMIAAIPVKAIYPSPHPLLLKRMASHITCMRKQQSKLPEEMIRVTMPTAEVT